MFFLQTKKLEIGNFRDIVPLKSTDIDWLQGKYGMDNGIDMSIVRAANRPFLKLWQMKRKKRTINSNVFVIERLIDVQQ